MVIVLLLFLLFQIKLSYIKTYQNTSDIKRLVQTITINELAYVEYRNTKKGAQIKRIGKQMRMLIITEMEC